MKMALLSIIFVRHQVKQNAEEEVQQYMNNEVDNILYFEDRAASSLNAVHASLSFITRSFDPDLQNFPINNVQ